MGLLYRTLGMAAAVNQYLWRRRINFVPSNLVLVCTAAAIGVAAADDWRQARHNGREPLVLPVRQLADRPTSRTFVTVTGTLLPGGGFWYRERDDQGRLEKASMEFVPLMDPKSARGVLVQLNVPHRFTASGPAEITGMLREMRPFVSREIEPSGYRHNGIDYLPGFVLVDGDDPGSLVTAQVTVAITGTIVVLFVIVSLQRHVFFLASVDPAPDWHAAQAGGSIRATGTFRLGKHTKRFVNVPAVLGTLDTGELAVFANVDASSEYLGMTYLDRAGLWILPIAAGSAQEIQHGTLYFGRRALPSVRFGYRDAVTGNEGTAILSSPDGEISALAAAVRGGTLGAWTAADPLTQELEDATASTHPHFSI